MRPNLGLRLRCRADCDGLDDPDQRHNERSPHLLFICAVEGLLPSIRSDIMNCFQVLPEVIFKVDDHMVLLLSCVCLSSNMRKSRNLEGFDVMFDTWLLPALHTPHCRTCVVRVSLAHSSHPRFPEVVFGTFRFYRVLERKKSTTAAYLVRHLCIFSPLSLIYFEGYCRRYDCFLGLTNAEKQPF